MSMQKGINTYLKTQVATAKKSQLVLMLYDGLIRFGEQAIEKIKEKDHEGSYNFLIKMQKILSELMSSLNFEVDEKLCSNLLGLYHFMYFRLVDANIEKDEKKVQEVLSLIKPLRDAWAQAIKNTENNTSTGTSEGISIEG